MNPDRIKKMAEHLISVCDHWHRTGTSPSKDLLATAMDNELLAAFPDLMVAERPLVAEAFVKLARKKERELRNRAAAVDLAMRMGPPANDRGRKH